MKNLYNGTIYLFDEINVTEGRGYKDFGKGFYATAIPAHAETTAIINDYYDELEAQNYSEEICQKVISD